MTPADIAAFRARLLELQGEALAQLIAAVPIIDAGMLRLVADIRATLAVLDDASQRMMTPRPRFMRSSGQRMASVGHPDPGGAVANIQLLTYPAGSGSSF